MEELEIAIMNHGNYYNLAFDAFARMELPDFSELWIEDVFEAFDPLYRLYDSRHDDEATATLQYMQREVNERSGGLVSLAPTEFSTGIKGPNVQFELTDGTDVLRLIFGPYGKPFEFPD